MAVKLEIKNNKDNLSTLTQFIMIAGGSEVTD